MSPLAKPTPSQRRSSKRSKHELVAAAIFVAVHLLAPGVVGEMYPFTISPMFCDQPAHCCTYRIVDRSGEELDPAIFNLHLVYDGNPPGLGMGIAAKEPLHAYCVPCDQAAVTRHVQAIMKATGTVGPLTIERRHLAPQDNKIVETLSKWQVVAPADRLAGGGAGQSIPVSGEDAPAIRSVQ